MDIKRAYFIGVGGIGMSAIARYYNTIGVEVLGYDKTKTKLTDELIKEGIKIHFTPNIEFVNSITDKDLVVFTPAVPIDFVEFKVLQKNKIKIFKRSEVLGLLSKNKTSLAVAGTHGKTTTSALLSHIINQSSNKTNAFLGGISSNYNSNIIINPKSEFMVLEADEFDRSFLQLSPFSSIITSLDADHLDIYKNKKQLNRSFQKYVNLINKNGCLIHHKNVKLNFEGTKISYGLNCEATAVGSNLEYNNNKFFFRYKYKNIDTKIELGLPGTHNAENAVAAITLALQNGISIDKCIEACKTFKGVKRRFEIHNTSKNQIYIDDYAHHPTELSELFNSLEFLYPNEEKLVVFQPHLFSRTRDFLDSFAQQLSRIKNLILMPIYPAREKPIKGITSNYLASKINNNVRVLNHEETLNYIKNNPTKVIVTVGAGDIDKLIPKIKEILSLEK